jgi:serine/threonine-protein kinase
VVPADRILDGKYRLGRVIHEGERALVLECTHVELRERFAVKILQRTHADPRLAARLRREARQAALIKSPHAVRYVDIGALADGRPYVVMELLVGETLAQRIATVTLTQPIAADVVLETCDALACAHVRGIVHRDLRPTHLYCVSEPSRPFSVKVLNFGTGRATDPVSGTKEDEGLTVGALALDAPDYKSPEQIAGKRDLDGRVDVWALGVILYQMLTARHPFAGATMQETLQRVLTGTTAPAPELSREAAAIVQRCLRVRSDERWANVAELAAAVGPLASPTMSRYTLAVAQILATPPPASAESDEETAEAPTVVREVLSTSGQAENSPAALDGRNGPLPPAPALPRIDDGRSGARSWPWLRMSKRPSSTSTSTSTSTSARRPARASSSWPTVVFFLGALTIIVASLLISFRRVSVDVHVESKAGAATTTSAGSPAARAPRPPEDPPPVSTPGDLTPAAPDPPVPQAETAVVPPPPGPRARAARPVPAARAGAPPSAPRSPGEDPWGWQR